MTKNGRPVSLSWPFTQRSAESSRTNARSERGSVVSMVTTIRDLSSVGCAARELDPRGRHFVVGRWDRLLPLRADDPGLHLLGDEDQVVGGGGWTTREQLGSGLQRRLADDQAVSGAEPRFVALFVAQARGA